MAQAGRLKLRFTGKAERQLAAISKYIGKDNPKAALRTLREIRAAAFALADFPEMGRPGAVPTTREWVVSGLPHIIVYRPISSMVNWL